MKRRGGLLLMLAGAVVVLSLSGCVYLRLLKLKRQLRDFDVNIVLGGRRSWTAECLRPVLTAEDAVFLVGAPPLSVSTAPTGVYYDYAFEMVRSTPTLPTALEKLSLRLLIENGMLKRVEVPETFLLYFSRQVVEEIVRAVPTGNILELQKMLRETVHLSKEADAELPSLDRTLLLMGEPLELLDVNGLKLLIYRYRIVDDTKAVPIIARFTFTQDGDMKATSVTWDTSTVEVSFVRD